ncbi:P-loop containing nucleoside triphosphate hydrolase protein, partial [Mycena rebaudengoi]
MPPVQPPTKVKNLIAYTTLAATTAQEIAKTTQVPFLVSTSALTLSIVKCVEGAQRNKDQCFQMVEQIHEILCTILKLYSESETLGVLPTALLYDIGDFTATLEKLLTFLKAQGRMGKIKQVFRQLDTAVNLKECSDELSRAQETFAARAASSKLLGLMHMRKDTKQQHEDLVALLKAHPQLTDSDASTISDFPSSFGGSSVSLSMLPPSPQIFHGRDSELQQTVNVLIKDSARIAILGPGGMGKTSLATVALHADAVVEKYLHRYFVQCHSTPTCIELVWAIADHIGVEKGSNLLNKVAQYFMHAPPSLLVLDNLETSWESVSTRNEVEEFLSLLTDVPHLALMITMRGAERPAKVKWTQPFLAPLQPLSASAAYETFIEVADNIHEAEKVKQLLEHTGHMPLAISLMANVAAHEGCDKALSRWKTESTRMLSDGYDKRSSLDISIMLSFTSSRMTSGAQDLLSILSMLPDGFTDAELLQAELPITAPLASKTTLLRTGLASVDKDKRLQVLAPIRVHILHTHPPTN